ncbi:hypothetical protein Emed_003767 [Eimeria media]
MEEEAFVLPGLRSKEATAAATAAAAAAVQSSVSFADLPVMLTDDASPYSHTHKCESGKRPKGQKARRRETVSTYTCNEERHEGQKEKQRQRHKTETAGKLQRHKSKQGREDAQLAPARERYTEVAAAAAATAATAAAATAVAAATTAAATTTPPVQWLETGNLRLPSWTRRCTAAIAHAESPATWQALSLYLQQQQQKQQQ